MGGDYLLSKIYIAGESKHALDWLQSSLRFDLISNQLVSPKGNGKPGWRASRDTTRGRCVFSQTISEFGSGRPHKSSARDACTRCSWHQTGGQ